MLLHAGLLTDFKSVDLTICQSNIRFGENVCPNEIYASFDVILLPKLLPWKQFMFGHLHFCTLFPPTIPCEDDYYSRFSISNVLMNNVAYRRISSRSNGTEFSEYACLNKIVSR